MRDPGNEVGFPLQKNNAGIVVAMIDAESECVLSILHWSNFSQSVNQSVNQTLFKEGFTLIVKTINKPVALD